MSIFSLYGITKNSNRVISKEEFLGESRSRNSSRRGSMAEKEAKADLAFKVFDKNHDGYITKEEMLKTSKNLTKKQVTLDQNLFHVIIKTLFLLDLN